jgi:hypothetical protein
MSFVFFSRIRIRKSPSLEPLTTNHRPDIRRSLWERRLDRLSDLLALSVLSE